MGCVPGRLPANERQPRPCQPVRSRIPELLPAKLSYPAHRYGLPDRVTVTWGGYRRPWFHGDLLPTTCWSAVQADSWLCSMRPAPGRNLHVPSRTSRGIGVAIGVLMTSYKLPQVRAFDLLRVGSHNTNQKMRDIAEEDNPDRHAAGHQMRADSPHLRGRAARLVPLPIRPHQPGRPRIA
jgi:hypothetical protein